MNWLCGFILISTAVSLEKSSKICISYWRCWKVVGSAVEKYNFNLTIINNSSWLELVEMDLELAI
ncbi:MAG: hypothetical protein ACW99A_22080 [Candidatus Kariarchaeaceae archaeon]|jgi:hypothetical protein